MSGKSARKRSQLTGEDLRGWIALVERAQKGETADVRARRAKVLLDLDLASPDEQKLLELLVHSGAGGEQ